MESSTPRRPDVAVGLAADPLAPRRARQAVGEVGGASPDLRDAVALLVSSLVSRACRLAAEDAGGAIPHGAAQPIHVRAWMPRGSVRVEVGAGHDPLEEAGRPDPELEYDVELLDGLTDRWGHATTEVDDHAEAVVWFEIDRRAA